MVDVGRQRMLEGLVRTNPLALLILNDASDIQYISEFLPYSTGFEIECYQGISYKKQYFTSIPLIMEVASGEAEQRYRIPNGINGILCLYFISIQAKLHLTLNPESGIHYHCDCINIPYQSLMDILRQKEEFILGELDSWGAAHSRAYGSWYRYNNLGTVEYRVGEMSFDYKVWIERVIHANRITRYLKELIGYNKEKYDGFDKKVFIDYLKTIYKNKGLTKEEKEILDKASGSNPNQVVKNRVIKL